MTAMTDAPVNLFQFADDIARLKADLEHAANEYHPLEHQDPAALGFLTVIRELTSGTDPVIAVAKAMEAYNDLESRKREHEEATEARRRQEEQELAVEEEVTRKVTCPICGSEAGMKCRGTGASGGLKKKSHADRSRLARGLGDSRGRS
ncbi:zinc finger domain-containing protein [Streptomyces sp. NPDC004976]